MLRTCHVEESKQTNKLQIPVATAPWQRKHTKTNGDSQITKHRPSNSKQNRKRSDLDTTRAEHLQTSKIDIEGQPHQEKASSERTKQDPVLGKPQAKQTTRNYRRNSPKTQSPTTLSMYPLVSACTSSNHFANSKTTVRNSVLLIKVLQEFSLSFFHCTTTCLIRALRSQQGHAHLKCTLRLCLASARL